MKNNINFSSNRRRKKNPKKIFLVACIAIALAAGIGFGAKGALKFVAEAKAQKIETEKKEKEEKLAAEKKRKEEEEAKKKMVGVGPKGKQYADDALVIAEKLKKFDYKNDGKKVVYLTFDDGASTTVTPSILKTLKENNVKGTFFITGNNVARGGQKAKDLIKQEINEGHAVANHSYSHDYKYLYPNRNLNLDNFNADFKKNDDVLKSALGPNFSTRVIRCPGGHMSWKNMAPLDQHLKDNNMASIDWNALNGDAEGKKKNAEELLQHTISTSKDKEMVVVLMHDTYGKEETAKALPGIIKHFKDNGYEFRTLA